MRVSFACCEFGCQISVQSRLRNDQLCIKREVKHYSLTLDNQRTLQTVINLDLITVTYISWTLIVF